MVKIENEYFGENERVIHKRLVRLGYKKVNNQYQPNGEITSNITVDKKREKNVILLVILRLLEKKKIL